jgi:hypothetical protein
MDEDRGASGWKLGGSYGHSHVWLADAWSGLKSPPIIEKVQQRRHEGTKNEYEVLRFSTAGGFGFRI